jgi:hypothetical protein
VPVATNAEKGVPPKDDVSPIANPAIRLAQLDFGRKAQEKPDTFWSSTSAPLEKESAASEAISSAHISTSPPRDPGRSLELKTGITVGMVAGVLIAACGFWASNVFSHRGINSPAEAPPQSLQSNNSPPGQTPSASSSVVSTDSNSSGSDSGVIDKPPSDVPVTAATSAEDSPKDSDASVPSPDSKESVQRAVSAWVTAFRSKDANTLATSYAPNVEKYFRRENVSREEIQGYFESAFARIISIRTYEVDNIGVESLPIDDYSGSGINYSRAAATFHKTWETAEVDGKTFSGEEIERLTFASSPDGWKIVREEEINIIRASRR